MPSFHDPRALEEFRRRHRLDPARIRALRNAFYKHRLDVSEAVQTLPPDAATDAERHFAFEHLAVESRHDSEQDGATKLILATPDGHRVESVLLRIATGRTSLCVSSQVGCAAACSFCATGMMGLQRNLTADEIVDQVAQANRLLRAEGRRVRNLVFMGMGEPLHNEEPLHRALDLLIAPDGFDHPPRRILVSTVGIPTAMQRLSTRFPKVQIALSLHAARQGVREQIVPLAARHSVEELRATVAAINHRHGQPIMVEYVMLDGINDSDADLTALMRWCDGLIVHINLIPFNQIDGSKQIGTDAIRRRAFANTLKEAGHKVTLRYSLGSDIEAACGQLVRRERRRRGAPHAS